MRAALVIWLLLMFAACGVDTIEHAVVDADVDAPIDAEMGSNAMASLEPSPRDGNLEIVVIAASLLVVVGPVGVMRRSKKQADDPPPFS